MTGAIVACAVLALWAPGAVAATNACRGANGALGNYAPGTNLEGYFGASRAGSVSIGVDTFDSTVYVLVTSPSEPYLNITKDPHWYVAVGGEGFSSGNISTLASRQPVIGYVDALTNAVIEYIPTSSGSNSLALDETNYVAFLPVNGVANSKLPAGDFTGNGVKLCGNGVTDLNGVQTGRGCVIVFRQQYLSKAK